MDRLHLREELFNGLLDMLPKKEIGHVTPLLSVCEVRSKEVIAEPDVPVSHIYFPCNAVMASVVEDNMGSMVETALTGADGFAPVGPFFGKLLPDITTICKVGGTCLRMRAADFLYECRHNPDFHFVMQLYVEVYHFQLSQRVACARLHSLKERYARAILALLDRTGSPDIPITQELLAKLLGVHRPSLNEFARSFEAEGAIQYLRGHMIVNDQSVLERHACECYTLTRRESERVLGVRAG